MKHDTGFVLVHVHYKLHFYYFASIYHFISRRQFSS